MPDCSARGVATALRLEPLCFKADHDAGGGSSNEAQVVCSPRERKVTGDGIPGTCQGPSTPKTNWSSSMHPSVAVSAGWRAPLTSTMSSGLALVKAERDLPYIGNESTLNKFPGRRQSFQGAPQRRSMIVGCVSDSFKGVRQRKGVRGFLVEIRPHKWKKTIWLGTYNTAEEAAGAYDAGIFYTGKNAKYNFPELKGTFPPLPSTLRLESVDDQEKFKAFVQQQARDAARLTKHNIRKDCQHHNSTVGEDLSGDLQPKSNSKYAVDRQRSCAGSCDAIDEDSLMSRLAPSIRKYVEDAIKHDRSVNTTGDGSINDDDRLISRLAPSIRKEVEDTLSSTLRPLVCALRSREEEDLKHREKLLALEKRKLALKLAIERLRLRVARYQPHRKASSHSGNRVKTSLACS